ncbi:hypothetical protein VKT23_015134 [Stygiomarasmius scandens]|uniref:DUF6532 domain-containing protein n=1 Tax=Marasmiellus scandens TaxID=2682957 RepID=A0ABR1J1I5_9AGAR
MSRRVLDLTTEELLKYLVFEHAMPDDLDQEIVNSWARATENRSDRASQVLNLYDRDIRELRGVARKLHVNIRKELRPMVAQNYGFKYGRGSQLHNRELHLALHSRISFIFKDPSNRKGFYRNPIIFKTVAFILDLVDEIDYDDKLLDGVPLPTLALALVSIEQAINEWQTGKFVPLRSDSKIHYGHYGQRFLLHLRTLSALDSSFKKRLQEQLLVEYCSNEPILLDQADLDRVAKEASDDDAASNLDYRTPTPGEN